MKTFVVFCLVAVAFGKELEISNEQKEIATRLVAECIKETGVDESAVEEFRSGVWKEDDKLYQFHYCFFSRAGIVDAEGKLVIDTALAKLPVGADKEVARQVFQQCASLSGSNPGQTTAKILKCYRDNTKQPIKLQF